MFAHATATGESIPLADAKLLTPAVPGKMIALVDNYRALVAKLGHAVPNEPLYFLKAGSSFLAAGETIRMPKSYSGKVIYEGELGIVIGRRLSQASEADAEAGIFGYTCINDVTRSRSSPGTQALRNGRAPSFDTFGIRPGDRTGIDLSTLRQTILNVRRGRTIRSPISSFHRRSLIRTTCAGGRGRHRLRHVDRCGFDEAGQHGQRRHRRHRHADQSIRVIRITSMRR
jgi:hypothetical protein